MGLSFDPGESFPFHPTFRVETQFVGSKGIQLEFPETNMTWEIEKYTHTDLQRERFNELLFLDSL